jgi:hypothetical protein
VLQLPEIVEGKVGPGGGQIETLATLEHPSTLPWVSNTGNQFLNREGIELLALLR